MNATKKCTTTKQCRKSTGKIKQKKARTREQRGGVGLGQSIALGHFFVSQSYVFLGENKMGEGGQTPFP